MGAVLMADPAPPPGFTLDPIPTTAARGPVPAFVPPPPGYTLDGPWNDYAPHTGRTSSAPADGPWNDYAPAPLSHDDYIGGLKQLMMAPGGPDRAAIHAFTAANNRADSGTLDTAIDWINHNPGHAGEVQYQDLGPQQTQQPGQPPAQQPQTMAVAPDSGFKIPDGVPLVGGYDAGGGLAAGIRGGVNGYLAGAGDKIGAAIGTVIPTAGEQNVWQGHSFSDAYAHNKAFEFGQSQADEQAHPVVYNGAMIGGAIASPVAKIGEGVAAARGLTGLAGVAVDAILGVGGRFSAYSLIFQSSSTLGVRSSASSIACLSQCSLRPSRNPLGSTLALTSRRNSAGDNSR